MTTDKDYRDHRGLYQVGNRGAVNEENNQIIFSNIPVLFKLRAHVTHTHISHLFGACWSPRHLHRAQLWFSLKLPN